MSKILKGKKTDTLIVFKVNSAEAIEPKALIFPFITGTTETTGFKLSGKLLTEKFLILSD
ncbi:hypothetical protein [Malacoplasma iowae]|uniref:Uncharacterized protein n=1 Tax=Malacoplasma iowae 695 TaxID=1048830 RepID=A0A6P1LI08_MALIO|nr:hypothetical protein [Malacoplasma iowae]QHG90270.1 hypothetical protein EER00_00005 [Malacoplasma iowae 695]